MATAIKHTFRTLNNRVDPTELKPDEMAVAQNVDCLDDSSIARRKGRTLVLSASGAHSFWSDPAGEFAFYGESSTLKRFWADGTATTLATLTTDELIDFVAVNNIFVYSSATDIGYISDGVAGAFEAPTDQSKIPTAEGRFVAFYNGRLYTLSETGLYYTDAYAVNQMDERNCLIPLLGEPTMLKPVDDGLWVGKGDKTIWLGGGSPEEFTYREYTDPVVPGTATAHTSPHRIGIKASGKIVLWGSSQGLCVGVNGGGMTVLTEDVLAVKPATQGSAIIREAEGHAHYLVVLKGTGTEYNKFTDAGLTVSSQTIGG